MAIVFADRVKVRTRTSGTGSLTLENTVDGFQSFEAVGNGNQTYYGIEHPDGSWEIGLGTYNSAGPSLSRDSILSSSNAGALVNFAAGSKTVFVTIPSSVAANIIASTTFAFRDIAVSGQTTVSADSTTDTLTLVAGNNIDITTNATTDTITIDNNLSSISQDVLPSINSDGTTGFTLGSPSFQWKELFVSNGSIYIGNVKLSNVAGKLAVTKVIRPGEDDEEDDPEDSDAGSEVRASNKLVNDDHEFVLESDGTLTLDGDPFTGGGGGGDTGNITFNNNEISSSGDFVNIVGDEYAQLQSNGNYVWVDNSGAHIGVNESGTFDFERVGDTTILKLPVGGDIVNSDGDSVLGGGATSYTPDDTDNWEDPTVNTIAAALDELAARVTALQNFEIDGGNAYTPPEGELLIDGNGA